MGAADLVGDNLVDWCAARGLVGGAGGGPAGFGLEGVPGGGSQSNAGVQQGFAVGVHLRAAVGGTL